MTSLSRLVKGCELQRRVRDRDYNILADVVVRAFWLTEKNTRPIMHRSILKPRAHDGEKSRKSGGTRAPDAIDNSHEWITRLLRADLNLAIWFSWNAEEIPLHLAVESIICNDLITRVTNILNNSCENDR